MCSNTSLSSGCGGGACGGDNGSDYLYSKKPKRQRVPKRGPGVAELEKILREQEKKSDLDHQKIKNDGFSLVSSLSSTCYHHQPHIPSTSKNVSLSPIPNHFTPPTTTSFYNHANNNGNSNPPPLGGGKNGVQIAGSGVVLPEHALLPTMWSSSSCQPASVDVGGDHRSAHGLQFSTNSLNGSNNNNNNNHHPQMFIPSPRMMQRSHQSPPSMKNLFPHSPAASSSSTTISSAGPCHGREPPSNQTSYYHCTSAWPEEDKVMVVGVKRSRPFSMEIPPIPPLQYSIPPFLPHTNRLNDSTLSCGSHSLINLEPTETTSREMKPVGCSMETSIRTCSTDNAGNGNFLLFGSPSTPPTQRERPKFTPCPFQESNEDYLHHLPLSQVGSKHKKPFYSFLLPREQIGTVEPNFIGLNNDRGETRENSIDLSLRL
ncbi:hypothetical protein JCGZ_21525 [Jatropha curcas]|uniref:Uncharacterized protein n=1 Tax=Jatropha curcas TaxID=180498 RepID=A0A067JNG8_JATCU|nr:hypothetical protein JCGZ_21525 [Jatropha curcas]